MTPVDERPIALVGLMGAGKSAVAAALGERLGVAVADLDAMVEAGQGRSVASIFERDGEASFRRLEGLALGQALSAGARVLACGGGIVLDPAHRSTLTARCRVVWLEVEPAAAAARVAADGGKRPLLTGAAVPGTAEIAARLAEFLAARRALYAEVAAVRVAVADRSAAQVAVEVLRRLGESAG
jgi:shikimate kinase